MSWVTWLLFTGVPARCVASSVWCPGPLGSCSPVGSPAAFCYLCGVLGWLDPVHSRARSVRCLACAVSWATSLLFTGVLAPCVTLRVRCPGPLGSCSPVCLLLALCCVCGVLGHLTPFHLCARSVCWVELRVRCPGSLRSCSPLCPLGVLCYVCGALGPLAPIHRWALRLRLVAFPVSWASWLLFTGVAARCAVLRVPCPAPLGSCSPLCSLCALCCVCGVLGHLAPVRRCARSLCCVACAVSWATWLLFSGVPAQCIVLRVQCPGPPPSCSPVCSLGALCCVCGVLGQLALVHWCARSVRYVAWAVPWAPWLLFTGVLARCVVWHVRCLGPLGSCSPVCSLGVLCCITCAVS